MRKMICGVVAVLFSAAIAFAGNVGTPPLNQGGPALIDQTWLNGLAGGVNSTFQNGITAAGTTQATCTVLPNNITLIEVDTVASGTGICLPPALPGIEISIYNNGANTLTVYPAINNNPNTGAQDTISNASSTTMTTHTSLYVFSAKNGVWASK